ncbi:MAG: hypothetical protein M0Z94_02065 [Dehalococcoidales bacterium]|nr:hypothetical protein [Dehalococcoidales bacterium]
MQEAVLRIVSARDQVKLGADLARSVVAVGAVVDDTFTRIDGPFRPTMSGSLYRWSEEQQQRYFEYVPGYTQRLLALLAAYRPFGWQKQVQPAWRPGSHRLVKEWVQQAGTYLPSEWLRIFAMGGPLQGRVLRGSRSYYDPWKGVLGISGMYGGGVSATLHEMVHRIEHFSPLMQSVVVRFLHRLQTEDLTAAQRWEEYQESSPGRAHEILSWGLEMLYFNPADLLNDEKTRHFLLGLLVSA